MKIRTQQWTKYEMEVWTEHTNMNYIDQTAKKRTSTITAEKQAGGSMGGTECF